MSETNLPARTGRTRETFRFCMSRIWLTTALILFNVPSLLAQNQVEINGFFNADNSRLTGDFSVAIEIVNKGDSPINIVSVTIVPEPVEDCSKLPERILKPKAKLPLICRINTVKSLDSSVAVQVRWSQTPEGAGTVGTFKIISPPSSLSDLLSAAWFGWILSIIGWILFILLLTFTVIRGADSVSTYHRAVSLGLLLSIAMVGLIIGLWQTNPIIFTTSFVGVGIIVLFSFISEDRLKKLLDRIVKAGPVELSPLKIDSENYQIYKFREDQVKETITVESIVKASDSVERHKALIILENFLLESDLLTLTPPCQPESINEKIVWIRDIKSKNSEERVRSVCDQLEKNYAALEIWENFGSAFSPGVIDKLSAKPVPNIAGAIMELENLKLKIQCGAYFSILARLYLVDGATKQPEKALALLYEGVSMFPTSIPILVWLNHYLGVFSQHYSAAIDYGFNAIDAIEKRRKQIAQCYEHIKTDPPTFAFAKQLRDAIIMHQGRWKNDLDVSLLTLRASVMNNVADYIASGKFFELEMYAREFAKEAVEHDSKNPSYLDTLGLVKLTMLDNPISLITKEKVQEELKEAARIFSSAIYLTKTKGDFQNYSILNIHLTRCIEKLQRL